MTFAEFSLSPLLLQMLKEQGYTSPTPIQEQAIPIVCSGKDLLGIAQTGTGKTAAFALPVLDLFLRNPRDLVRKGPRCLVLTPTRELAIQVADSFKVYGGNTKLSVAVVFGGVGIEPQKAALRRKPDVLVATPGRLLDLMQQGECSFSQLEVFILDEADRMFDMGFIRDIRKIVATLPSKRQTLLFSATMPKEIEQLASSVLTNPSKVAVSPVSKTAETIEQFVYFVDSKNRIPLLTKLLKENPRCIVFTKMKHVANRVSETLRKEGISAEAFHSNKSQNARQRILGDFRDGKIAVLVATDIAARGLDIDDIEIVVNFDLPDVPETYVHRIGRAGRAGRSGTAWSLVDKEQQKLLQDIERTTKCSPEIVSHHPFVTDTSQATEKFHAEVRLAPPGRSIQIKVTPNGGKVDLSNRSGPKPIQRRASVGTSQLVPKNSLKMPHRKILPSGHK